MSGIRSIALGVALVAGSATLVAAQSTTTTTRPGNAASAEGAPRAWGRHRGAHDGGMRRLFGNLNLSDAQKQQIRTIHQKYQPQLQALRDSMRPAVTEARTARQRGDTAAARAAIARISGTRDRVKTLRTQELAEVRAILTPEQRTKLDANIAKAKEHRGERIGGARGHHHGRKS